MHREQIEVLFRVAKFWDDNTVIIAVIEKGQTPGLAVYHAMGELNGQPLLNEEVNNALKTAIESSEISDNLERIANEKGS